MAIPKTDDGYDGNRTRSAYMRLQELGAPDAYLEVVDYLTGGIYEEVNRYVIAAESGKGRPAVCGPNSVAPSFQKRLKGYARMNEYSDTAAGKRAAEAKADQYRNQSQGDVQIRVFRLKCRDLGETRWTVWVKAGVSGAQSRTARQARQGKFAEESFGTGSSRSARGDWEQYRGVAKKTAECPKCGAQPGSPCVKDLTFYPEGGDFSELSGEDKKRLRTNPHKERVEAYLKTQVSEEEVVSDKTPSQRLRRLEFLATEAQLEMSENDAGGAPTDTEGAVEWWESIITPDQRVKYEAFLRGEN
jgi:hypothetical protein